jgi:hypothetical protein
MHVGIRTVRYSCYVRSAVVIVVESYSLWIGNNCLWFSTNFVLS